MLTLIISIGPMRLPATYQPVSAPPVRLEFVVAWLPAWPWLAASALLLGAGWWLARRCWGRRSFRR